MASSLALPAMPHASPCRHPPASFLANILPPSFPDDAAASLAPPGATAQSLIQRWRELEAVGPNTPRTPEGDDPDSSQRGRALKKELSPPPTPEAATGTKGPPLLVRPVRGRRDMEELVARMAHCRGVELAALAERHAVSRFAHKGRLQSMLRLRLLRQGDTGKDEVWTLLRPVRPIHHHPPTAPTKPSPPVVILRSDTQTSDLPKQNNSSEQSNGECSIGEQHNKNDAVPPADEKIHSISIDCCVTSDGLCSQQCDEQMSSGGNQCQEDCASSAVCIHDQEDPEASGQAQDDEQSNMDDHGYVGDFSPSHTASKLCQPQCPPSRADNLADEDHSPNGSWEERALWMSSLGWLTPADNSTSPDSWHRDVIGDLEKHNEIGFNDCPWVVDSPNSWRSLCVATQADGHALSRNAEICQLLKSKSVSKSLSSDFSKKMNHLMLKIIRKQRQKHMISYSRGCCDERSCRTPNSEPQDADQASSMSCPLVPDSHEAFYQPENWQHDSFTEEHHHAAQSLLEMEDTVRSEIAQIHHEIYELRKLVETCIESQVKMQHSVKDVVCSAVRQAVQTELMSIQHNTTTTKRGTCCICHEMPVDSLLYRCGHMCTCFECGGRLKSSSGDCPICRSPIDDVVRAHPSF